MMVVTWVVLLAVIGVALAVFSRGAPRVLSLVALVVAGGSIAINVLVAPVVFERLGGGATGFVLAVLNMAREIVVLGLFIAAAALASRPPARVGRTGALR